MAQIRQLQQEWLKETKMTNPKCCGQTSRWVDNVPGSEYWYCGECKQEVKEKHYIPQDHIETALTELYCSDEYNRIVQYCYMLSLLEPLGV